MIKIYINNFKGFPKEVWFITLVSFINRAGTMIIPFLSRYMIEALHFNYTQVGWVMVCFGVGSMIGSWLGGKLTDSLGFYNIMVASLFSTGILFILLQYVTSFYGLCIAIFLIMIIADMFRPAMFVSVTTYAGAENRMRAFSLVRLSVNLGFAGGPALAGLIIASMGYSGLFWVDGLTCIIAIVLFLILLPKKEAQKKKEETPQEIDTSHSVWKDKIFWILLSVIFLIALMFFQLFTIMPMYQAVNGWSEKATGFYLALNGFLVFLFEMPIVSHSERTKKSKVRMVFMAAIMIMIAYGLLLLPTQSKWILIAYLLLLSFGEIYSFPTTNALAYSRAPKGHEGRYMAVYSMAFSLAHIVGTKLGTTLIQKFGYRGDWIVMFALSVICVLLIVWLRNSMNREVKSKN